MNELLDVTKNNPPKDCTFLAYDKNQSHFEIVWYSKIRGFYKKQGGDFYGTLNSPKFTHFCNLPDTKNVK